MTAPKTDRYLRKGGDIPQIYAGTLRGLNTAIADAMSASKYLRGKLHRVFAVRGKDRTLVRAFRDGEQVEE